MNQLNSHEVIVMFLGLAVLIASARTLGELAKWLGLPSVVGEILAGILLGPTVLGFFAPRWFALLFPSTGPNATVLNGFRIVAIALFLLVAGAEVDLSTIWRQGRSAITIGLASVAVPFGLGFVLARCFPQWLGYEQGASPLIHALFIATALAISALPVIAKILMDLNIYRSDMGMIIIAAAVFGDLIGWILFAVILGMLGGSVGHAHGVLATILMTLGFAGILLTVGRGLIHLALVRVQAYTTWPGGVLTFTLTLGLLGAALTEWIGVHAIFGCFLVGVAIGDSPQLKEQTRMVIDQFISFFFVPLFFATIGLQVDFGAHFDLLLVLTLLLVTCAGKLAGCFSGARLSGMSRRESLAVSACMITQGTMGIIMGLLALRSGVIGERLFVAIVIVSLITSMISGPAMQRILRRKKTIRLADLLTAKTFVHRLRAATREAAIAELSEVLGPAASLPAAAIAQAVLIRERIMPTGLGRGVAVPHTRLAALNGPLVGLGLSGDGIDFDAPDGKPSQIILMILTPLDDESGQLELFADIAKIFRNRENYAKALQAENYSEFLALIKTEL
jgi:Kef-type K+ transport system membrane component KefB/mannitol/fructose-specific phosphotransferase system IIA component (Ntr-type)